VHGIFDILYITVKKTELTVNYWQQYLQCGTTWKMANVFGMTKYIRFQCLDRIIETFILPLNQMYFFMLHKISFCCIYDLFNNGESTEARLLQHAK